MKKQKGEVLSVLLAILIVIGFSIAGQADDDAGNCMTEVEAREK